MGIRDTLSDLVSLEDADGKTIEVYDPAARGWTMRILLFFAFIGILSTIGIDIGLLPQEVEWIPLGVILGLMIVNPMVHAGNFWEAILIMAMFANFLAYIIVIDPAGADNAALIAIALIFVVLIFEFPRRFGLK